MDYRRLAQEPSVFGPVNMEGCERKLSNVIVVEPLSTVKFE